jgi:formylglycine-generating enzyme required for sulfatase activity
MIKMIIKRVGERLRVIDQSKLVTPRKVVNCPFRKSPLTINITTKDGKQARAEDIFPKGKLDLRAHVLAEKGTTVEIFTPAGRQIQIEKLDGLKPCEIDVYLDKVDEIMKAVASRIETPELLLVSAKGKFFEMGSEVGFPDEKPVRPVSFTNDYMLGLTEVTNKQWLAYLEATDQDIPEKVSSAEGVNHPVVEVSWYEAIKYCNWLSQQQGLTPAYTITYAKDGRTVVNVVCDIRSGGYRLPIEAEWEFAARGTDGREYPEGKFNEQAHNYANNKGTTPVDKYPAGKGPFEHLDLSGNVYEWCNDWYGEYLNEAQTDPTGPETGANKVVRGGCWDNDAGSLRSAFRDRYLPEDSSDYVGLRVARTVIKP